MPLVHSQEELSAWLRLSLEPGIGPATAGELLREIGPPPTLYGLSRQALAERLPAPLAGQLRDPPSAPMREAVERALEWVQAPGRHVLTLGDGAYPQALRDLHDPPPVLYVCGDPAWLSRPAIAVVGARNATPDGLASAHAFARHLARQGWCIVSGMALGIDAAAHRGALEAGAAGGGTIAVVGTGADVVYPARHRRLAQEIEAMGAIVSEFPLGTPALAHQFPRRNRLVAGLARGTLVAEAALRSGSLITARLAAETGREVFAIPGSIHSPLARGCHALIRQGATLVESAEDILDELHGARRLFGRSGEEPGSAPVPADGLLAAMGYGPIHLDALAARSGLAVPVLQARLLALELQGRVARLDGGRYQVCRAHNA
ncbi:hypothetical protein PIGHUM_02549 [Pigmentiphaga humi]|uniref:Uncharacterized protein n=1 Tax=Pigmentiphaga humi TaxID=2478468 RepID=A0A3P4B2G3_9BURK|nr:DNA-processing protein DprA [Pigmentiphaga humi]VCU70477.1 hypothetical protein PIGHUM_02549 [Pigmentiphaga humi]